MPHLEVTREHLEDLIQAVMYTRLNVALEEKPDTNFLLRLMDIHTKLEDTLELWINGGIIELAIPPHLQNMGIHSIQKVCPPHDEGLTKDD
jgi:hypothetical protein